MQSANAKIGVATAAMLPAFSLSGTYGVSGSSAASLLAGSGTFWSVGPTVTTPVFQGTSLWYGRRAAIDASEQARAIYKQTVLAAFEQVADALTALEHDAETLQAQVEARRVAGEVLNLIRANYRAGLVSYPEVLGADVDAHLADIVYYQAIGQRHQDTVALFVALGGGWGRGGQEEGAKGKSP